MKLVMEFDPNDPQELTQAYQLVSVLVLPVAKAALASDKKEEAPTVDAKASDKKADVKKAEEAAAAKKAEEDAAAAAKKAEEDAAAAAKKAEEEAAAAAKQAEEDDPLGDAGADDQPKLDRETVRQALTDYSKIEGRPAAIKLLTDNGAKSIAELPEDKFRAVYDAAQLKLKK